jgi:hypothetical protein
MPHLQKRKARRLGGGLASERTGNGEGADYFCHVRFLCRLALRRLRRLCFDIFRRRFFFRLPMELVSW